MPGFPYLHVGCWYQVERGGIADFSFAEFFPNRFRYKPGMDPPLPYNFEWTPDAFVWAEHGGALYDYFLVRGTTLDPFKGATTRIELVARHGEWAVYHQTRQTESSGRRSRGERGRPRQNRSGSPANGCPDVVPDTENEAVLNPPLLNALLLRGHARRHDGRAAVAPAVRRELPGARPKACHSR